MKQQSLSIENFQLKQTAQEVMSQVSEFDLPNLDQPLESANENNPATDYTDSPSCVGIEESGRIAYKLKLIFKNGNRHFFPYAYISEVAFDIEAVIMGKIEMPNKWEFMHFKLPNTLKEKIEAKESIKKLIARNDLEKALKKALDFASTYGNDENLNSLYLLLRRQQSWVQNKNKGIIDDSVEINKISNSFLDIIDGI